MNENKRSCFAHEHDLFSNMSNYEVYISKWSVGSQRP